MRLFRRRHRFTVVRSLHEEGVSFIWHRLLARCRRCGEERKIYHALDIDNTINREFCP